MFDRLTGACMGFLTAAAALYMAVRLIELIAVPLIVIAAVIGGLTGLCWVIVLVYRRYWSSRWWLAR
jgi:hypothetical protein